MSLWMFETKAVLQENAIVVKHFAVPVLTMTGCIGHTHTPRLYIFCALSKHYHNGISVNGEAHE